MTIPTDRVLNRIYKFNGNEYDLRITRGFARDVLKAKYGINLNCLFEDDNLDTLMNKIYMSDDLAEDLWWEYIKPPNLLPENEEAAKTEALNSISSLKEFKERWWDAVMDFFGDHRADMLAEVLSQVPKLFQKQLQTTLQELISTSGSSNS